MEYTYVPKQITQSQSNKITDQAFGPDNTFGRKDWNDTTTAAFNYLVHQQDNALAVDLMNYQNRYNSPQNQMLLRQAAGINPYSDYAVQAGASPNVSSSPAFRSQGTQAKRQQLAMQQIGTFLNSLETGQKIYDYITYGRDLSKYQLDAAIGRSGILSEQIQQEVMRTGMLAWMLGYPGYDAIGNSPYGQRYSAQTQSYEAQQQRVDAYKKQINYLVDNLYPSQKERNEALKQLDEQKYGIQEASYGAVVGINTGNKTADGILQFLILSLRELLHFGFSGRMF